MSEGTLSPGFSSAHTSYTASVGNAVSRITVTPTTNDARVTDFAGNSSAKPTVEYLDASDTALTDADTASTDSFEVDLSSGSNVIKVKVTAADGTTVKTYTVTVTRAAAPTDAILSALSLSSGTLSPTFASAHTSYTASVGNPVSRITVTPTTGHASATVTYFNASDTALTDADTASTDSFEVDLSEGANVIKVKVTAAEGAALKTYTVTVTRAAASTDANLSALSLSPGTLSPGFASADTSYTASVGYPVTRVTLSATASDAGATIAYLDGSDDALTDADTASTDSFEVDLSVGANVIKVKVTAEDGATVKTYTVTVTRTAASTDAALSALALSRGTLNPGFASADTSYTASVVYPVSRVTVTPTKSHASATVTYFDASDNALTDADTASTDSFEVDLSVGANVIKVKVTAEDATTVKTYTVTVTRAAASTDAALSALALSRGTLNPVFASADTSYTASVGYPVTRVTLSATASDAGATIAYLDGSDNALTDADTASTDSFEVDLSVGANVIKVKVTAEDATTVKTYTVTVTRTAASTDAALSALALSRGTLNPVFASADTSYTASVGYPVTRVTLSATASDAGATIAYLDGSDNALTDADTASTGSFEVDLSVGANVIKVKVTAEDATTTETYTVTVTRTAASTDAALSALALSRGTLSPVFASADTSYTASVVYAVTRVTVSPTTNYSNAGIAYLDGSDDALTDADTASTDSFEVDLSEGANVIKVKVTAEDGATTETYTVTVTRGPASTNAALSALALSPGTLSPAFASADTSYTASVVYVVTRVTVSPTKNQATATIAYLDRSDDALTDADTASTGSFEVDLSVGANVIKVKVTAENATTVKTYTVTVTRAAPSTDEDDFTATTATQGTVSVGGSATGEIEVRGDVDWFAVTLVAGQTYRINLEGSPTGAGTLVDPELRGVHDAAGTLIAGTTNDDGGTGYNSRLRFTAESSATYYVAAGAYQDRIGTYKLSVTEADDFAATTATQGTVSVDGSATGEIDYSGDVDWFAVTLEAGKSYRIDLEGSPTGAGTLSDPYLGGVHDAAGTRLVGTRNYDAGTGDNSRVTFLAGASATYYVAAGASASRDGTDTGTDTLTVTEILDDFTATTATEGRVSVGGSATGEIGARGDVDWFAVTLEAGKSYRIDLEGAWTSGAGTVVDPYLRGVHDAAGTLIAGTTNNNGGTRRNSRLTFAAESSATYYVAAGAAPTQTGTYTLSVTTVTPPPPSSLWTATLTVQDLGSGRLGCDDFNRNRAKGCRQTAVLTNRSVTYGTNTYNMLYIRVTSLGTLQLRFNAEISTGFHSDLVFKAGDSEFMLSDKSLGSSYSWTTSGLSWSEDDEVSLAFVLKGAPTAADGEVTMAEDTPYTFAATDFGFVGAAATDTLSSVKVTALPTLGSLTLDGTAVDADDSITKADIDASKLVFTPVANANGDGYTDFSFKLNDGTTESTAAYTMTIDVTAVNDVPAGVPTISGTARVGETLIASATEISDADGLTSAAFAWQWVRIDGKDETDITGATSITYVPVIADLDDELKVEVSFTDDDDTDEGPFSSAATAAVAAKTSRQVTRTNATLSALSLSPGTLNPTFSAAVTSYTASVGYAVTRVTVAPTKNQASATIAYLDGSDNALTDADTSSTGSFEVDLSVGANVIKVQVTAGNGITVNTYTVTVTRAAASTDASLSALALSRGTLSPAFSSAHTSYTASVGTTVERITVSPTTNDANAGVQFLDGYAGDAVLTDADTSSADTFEVYLFEGANLIKVKVTAEDGTATVTYPVAVIRAAPVLTDLLISTVAQGHLERHTIPVTSKARALKFSTGSYAATLHSVEFSISTESSASMATPTVKLFTGTESNNGTLTLGTEVASFAGPASLTAYTFAKTYTFTAAANTVLAAMTDYYILLEKSSDGFRLWSISTGGAVDSNSKAGWAVPSNSWSRTAGSTGTLTSHFATFLFRLRGNETYVAPGAPQDFTATAGHAEVTLRWTAPESDGGSAITHYQYRHATGSTVPTDTSWTNVADSSDPGGSTADETSVTVTSLTNGTEYAFEVRAVNSVGEGAKAGPVTATPAPTVTVAAGGEVDEGDGAEFTLTLSAAAPTGGQSVSYSLALTNPNPVADRAHVAAANLGAKTATIGAGETTATVTVATVDVDDLVSKNSTLTLSLTAAAGYGLGSTAAADVTITDTTTAELSISAPTPVTEGDDIRVTVAPPTGACVISFPVTVTLTPSGDTNGLGSADAKSLQVPACSSGTADFATANDSVNTAERSLLFTLSLPDGTASGITLPATPSVAVTVTDDEALKVTGVAVTSTPNALSTYGAGETISFTATFNGPVTVTGTPQFAFSLGGVTQQAALASGSDSAELVFSYTVAAGDNDADGVSWSADALALNGGTIKFMTGVVANQVDAALTHAAKTAQSGHKVDTPPVLSTRTVNETALVLTYNEALDTGSEPGSGAFTVKVGGTAVSLASSNPVAVSGSTVTLTLAAAVVAADTVTVSYAVPSSNPIQDAGGTDAPAFTDLTVTNGTGNTPPVFADATAARSFTETVGDAVATAGNVGAVVTATDADADPLTYSLEGTDAAKFTVNSRSGQIRTKAGERYDREAKASYAVRVKADDGKTGTGTVAVTISVADAVEIPLAPGMPAVSATSVSTTSLDVNWSAPINAGRPALSGYRLRYRIGSGAWTNHTHTGTGTGTTIGGLSENTEYKIQVGAVNADGDGPWSASGAATTGAVAVPGAPRDLAATAGDARVTLTWSAPASDGGGAITTYRYRYAAGTAVPSATAWTDAPDSDGDGDRADERDVTVTGLTNETQYAFEVQALNSAGGGPAAGARATPVEDPNLPSRVIELRAQTGDGTVTLEWGAPRRSGSGGKIARYEYRYAAGSSVPTSTSWASADAGRYPFTQITGLENGRRYAFEVRAVNTHGYKGAAAMLTATPRAPVVQTLPTAPRGLRAEGSLYVRGVSELAQVELRWQAPADLGNAVLVRYEYRYAASGESLSSWFHGGDVAQVTAGRTERVMTVRNLAPGTAYSFEVRAVTGVGAGPAATVRVTTPASGRIELSVFTRGAAVEGENLTVGVRRSRIPDPDMGNEEGRGGEVAVLAVVEIYDSAFSRPAAKAVDILVGAREATIEFRVPFDGARGAARELEVTLAPGTWLPETGYTVGATPATTTVRVRNRDPLLRVADATVREDPQAQLQFDVSLDRAAAVTVTLDYATSDGTAIAGADYTETSGMLSFAAGETAKTVLVPVLDDAHDESIETLTLTLSNAQGAAIDDATATGRIVNTDPMPMAWLARFGRTGATQVLGLLDARFDEARAPASQLTLGGRPVNLSGLRGALQGRADPGAEPAPADADPFDVLASRYTLDDSARGPAARHADPSAVPDPAAGRTAASPLTLRGGSQGRVDPGAEPAPADADPFDVLASRYTLDDSARGPAARHADPAAAIETARVRETPGHWSMWGRGALIRFTGQDRGLSLDGDVLTGLLGLDYSRGRWLAGVGLAYNDGNGAYRASDSGATGELDSTLVSVHPYLHYALTERLSAWGTLGYGAGGLSLRPGRDGAPELETLETDIQMRMGALGLRGTVFASVTTELALKSDLMWVRTASSATAGLAPVDGADASRVRLLLTGRHRHALATGAELTPNVELGLRYDDGAAETGAGVELGGGLRYADPALGLTVEATARALLAHEDSGYEEWGMGGSLQLDPGRLGRGLSLRLASGWGLTDSSTETLWQQQTTAGLTQGPGQTPGGRIRAEWAYGLDVPRTRGLFTPYGSVEMAGGGGRTLALGWRFELGQSLSLSLAGERREALHTTPEHALMLQTALPW